MGDNVKHMIQVESSIYDEIKEFCDLNDLKINVFINELIQKGFMIEKYGDTPFTSYNVAPNEDDSITVAGIKYSRDELANIISEYEMHFRKFGPNSMIRPAEEKMDIDQLVKIGEATPLDFLDGQIDENKPEEKEETIQLEQPIAEEKPAAKKPTKRRLK